MPSLTRLSPSTIVTSLRGTPSRRAIEVAASGSVGETIAPRTNALGHERSSMNACATTATPTVVAADESDREQADRSDVRPEITERREERRAVEQRREDAEEDELRLELELGHCRDDADREAAEHEQDRIRDPQRRSDREHRRDRDDQCQRDDAVLEVQMHRAILP